MAVGAEREHQYESLAGGTAGVAIAARIAAPAASMIPCVSKASVMAIHVRVLQGVAIPCTAVLMGIPQTLEVAVGSGLGARGLVPLTALFVQVGQTCEMPAPRRI